MLLRGSCNLSGSPPHAACCKAYQSLPGNSSREYETPVVRAAEQKVVCVMYVQMNVRSEQRTQLQSDLSKVWPREVKCVERSGEAKYKCSIKYAEARSRRVRRAIKGIKESLEGEIESSGLGIEGKCRATLALGNTTRTRYRRSEKMKS